MAKKWVRRWEVPKSSGDGCWIVALDEEGNYGCSCPLWKFRREECHHILEVKASGGKEIPYTDGEQRANLRLRAYAEKGYRYYSWYTEPLYPWVKREIDDLKRNPDIESVKTFALEDHRIVLIKERESAYEREFRAFVDLLKRCNLKRKYVRNPVYTGNWWEHHYRITQDDLRARLRKRWFDIVQHIIYNGTGVVNPNLPDGSVYNSGYWGQRIVGLQRHFEFLR